ncbi:MAG: hypothetical protein IT436_06150 [Phycisphaerales bacterium]|nr:hypothetical protein [Phycisphaerales bacterium]
MPPRRARARSILAATLAVLAGALGGCAASYPLGITNRSSVPISAELIPFREGADNSRDWDSLFNQVSPLQPGQRTSWKRGTRGVTYLLAVAGPGLRGPRGYVLFSIPAAPIEITIRGDHEHTGVWIDGNPPILLRP